MLPEEFLYQLKQSNPITEIMGSYVHLMRAGSLMKCLCPFHSEKSASCTVYPHNNSFYCFGCHAGGDVITFIMQIEGLDYISAVRMLAERAGLQMPQEEQDNGEAKMRLRILELNRAAANYYYKQLTGADKRGLQYLKERSLQPEIIRKYGLGFAGEQWDGLYKAMTALGYTDQELITANLCSRSSRNNTLYDRFRNRVIFPILDLRGSVIAFGGRTIEKDGTPKYLNSSDTPVFHKGRNLFSMNFAKKSQSKRIILAEGYMDVIAIHQAGFENVVASLGTALTPEQCRLIRQYAEEVVISYDSDAAGQNATVKAINLLRAAGIRPYILRMHDAKDPDEYIKKFGAAYFRRLLEESGDAMTYELDRCKGSTDTEGDTITALHKAVSVLAGIENELDREVYLSKVAKEYSIQTEILKAQVNQEIRKKQASRKKQEWRSVTQSAVLRDPVNPAADHYPKEAKAEEQILCYLFRQPDALETVMQQISPEDFPTDLHRRIFEHLAKRLKEGYSFSFSLFSDSFTPAEMGRIIGIQAKYDSIDFSEQSIADCLRILKQKQINVLSASDMNDTDFSAMFEELRRRKN
ncbi:MAG: DNA primase [Oscillospiraceae bacterium]|nr:DNA primase [Oscillospiraceae bacterium]